MSEVEALSVSDDGGSPVQQQRTARRKKSAMQVELLERLYAENKYPSEEVRAKLSTQLGLSEKQMQVWFTHRRHKDRKDGVEDVKLTFYEMRHKGGEAHLDFMEELSNGKGTRGSLLGSGDTPSSGGNHHHVVERKSDSESANSGLGEEDGVAAHGLKHSAKRGNLINKEDRIYKRPMTLPARSKVDGKALELAAITAVEAQLGGSIRVDGPQLALEFDTLPPDPWSILAKSEVAVPISVEGRGRMQGIGTY